MIWRWWGNQLFTRKQGKGHYCLGVLSWTGLAVPGFAVEQPQECWGSASLGIFPFPTASAQQGCNENSFQLCSCPSGFQSSAEPILGCFQSRDAQELPNLGIMELRGSVGGQFKDVWESLLNKRDPDSANCTETRELGGLKLWNQSCECPNSRILRCLFALWTFIAIFTPRQGTPEREE